MRKNIFFLILLLLFLMVSCVGNTSSSSNGEASSCDFSNSTSVETSAISIKTYTPYNYTVFDSSIGMTLKPVCPFDMSVAEYKKLIFGLTSKVCIALVTLVEIDFENSTEKTPNSGNSELVHNTPITVIIDEVLESNYDSTLNKDETLTLIVNDGWKMQSDGTYVIEYAEHTFPISEKESRYVVALIEDDMTYATVLSFPINSDGSYTETILKHKDSECFRKEQWSFSDEVLEKYGLVTE